MFRKFYIHFQIVLNFIDVTMIIVSYNMPMKCQNVSYNAHNLLVKGIPNYNNIFIKMFQYYYQSVYYFVLVVCVLEESISEPLKKWCTWVGESRSVQGRSIESSVVIPTLVTGRSWSSLSNECRRETSVGTRSVGTRSYRIQVTAPRQ